MAGGNISSEKIDLLVYGPNKPIVEHGFSDQFVLHSFETKHDLERLSPAIAGKIRGAAVTYNSMRGDKATLTIVDNDHLPTPLECLRRKSLQLFPEGARSVAGGYDDTYVDRWREALSHGYGARRLRRNSMCPGAASFRQSSMPMTSGKSEVEQLRRKLHAYRGIGPGERLGLSTGSAVRT